jgi:hypothetical protein
MPSVRRIGRILERRGARDAGRRIRRPPPPPGWYLPPVALRRAELDSFDTIQGLALQGGVQLEIPLHEGLPGAWPQPLVTAKTAVTALVEHWSQVGLPASAQFDNHTIFCGTHRWQDALGGRDADVLAPRGHSRLCAAAGKRLPGRHRELQRPLASQVWTRFHHDSLGTLHERSQRYGRAYRARAAGRIEAAPPRRPFPVSWQADLQAPPHGMMIFIRRTSETGMVRLLGRCPG